MTITSSADHWMQKFGYGVFLIIKLLIGMIFMRWSQLLATHRMDRYAIKSFSYIEVTLGKTKSRSTLIKLSWFVKGALVGSYKGTCCLYNTHDNKLQQRREINLKNRKKKTHHKKITGFQVKLKQLTPFCSHLFIYTTILFWMLYWFI
jgi:hypothetical protein